MVRGDRSDRWGRRTPADVERKRRERVARFWSELAAAGLVPVEGLENGQPSTAAGSPIGWRALAVEVDGKLVVPLVFIDGSGQVRASLGPALEILGPVLDPRELWAWFASPLSLLCGEVAVDVAETDPERVARAALDYLRQLED